MKKWIAVALAVFAPALAFAQSSTASRLGVYTTDNVPALTLGYTDQFGAKNGGSLTLKGATSGTLTLAAPAVAGTTNVLTSSSLATSTTLSTTTSSATLATVTGLSVPVIAGATYNCEARLYTTSGVAGGLKVALAGTTSMTATSTIYSAALYDTGTALVSLSRTTTFGTGLGATTTVSAANIQGSVVVNASGNLVVQAAQNAADGVASVVLAGSYINCLRSN